MLARCVPRQPYRRRHPTQGSGSGFSVQGAVLAWSQTGTRPAWLSDDLLRILEGRNGHLVGLIYLAHFERPIGDATNPRGFALHYTGKPASSGLLKALWRVSGREFAELSPGRAVSLDQTPSSIRSSHLQLDRPVRQGAIDDLLGAQLLPFRRPEDEVAHVPGRARNVALDQVQPGLPLGIATLDAHDLADQVDQLISAQPLRHGANDGPAGDRGPASGAGPRSGDIQHRQGRPAAQHPLRRVHASRTGPGFPDDRAGIVLACRESCRPAQARPTSCLTWDSRREPQPDAAANCRQIQHWTLNLPVRLGEHAAGRGARLMQVVAEQGIAFKVTRLWVGTRTRERSLKRQGGAARRCPVCRLAAAGAAVPATDRAVLDALELGDRPAGLLAKEAHSWPKT